jgi:hypothetical protein
MPDAKDIDVKRAHDLTLRKGAKNFITVRLS